MISNSQQKHLFFSFYWHNKIHYRNFFITIKFFVECGRWIQQKMKVFSYLVSFTELPYYQRYKPIRRKLHQRLTPNGTLWLAASLSVWSSYVVICVISLVFQYVYSVFYSCSHCFDRIKFHSPSLDTESQPIALLIVCMYNVRGLITQWAVLSGYSSF